MIACHVEEALSTLSSWQSLHYCHRDDSRCARTRVRITIDIIFQFIDKAASIFSLRAVRWNHTFSTFPILLLKKSCGHRNSQPTGFTRKTRLHPLRSRSQARAEHSLYWCCQLIRSGRETKASSLSRHRRKRQSTAAS